MKKESGQIHTIEFYSSAKRDNFHILRIVAALLVIYGHSFVLTRDFGVIDFFLRQNWGIYSGDIAINIFFVVSGFMVAGSFISRDSLFEYTAARALRILPGFICVMTISAFLIAPAFTSLSLTNYFSDPGVPRYVSENLLLNPDTMVWTLPGLFEGYKWSSINGSLWTLAIEVRMYFAVAILGVLGLLADRIYGSVAIGALFLAAYIKPDLFPFNPEWMRLAAYFFAGTFFQLNKNKISIRHDAMLILIVLAYASRAAPAYPLLLGAAITYFCFWFAYRTPYLNTEKYGDPSYGIYLWGWPIQQIVVTMNPSISPFRNFLAASSVCIVIGYISWFLLEKPAIAIKGKLKKMFN